MKEQSNKEQDALYYRGGDLSENDQQMVDDIRDSWENSDTSSRIIAASLDDYELDSMNMYRMQLIMHWVIMKIIREF